MKKKIGIGVDIGSTKIRFSKLSIEENSVRVLEMYEFRLHGAPPGNLSDDNSRRLQEFLQQNKIKIKKATASISGESLNLRYIRLPRVSQSRMQSAVELEISQMRENAKVDFAYSFLPLELPGENKVNDPLVVLAVVRSNYLDHVRRFFKQAGIEITGFVPSAFALYYSYVKIANLEDEKRCIGLLDIGHLNCDVAILFREKLVFLRNMHVGGSLLSSEIAEIKQIAIEEAEQYKLQVDVSTSSDEDEDFSAYRRIPDAIEASLKFARLQTKIPNLQIHHYLVTGGASLQKGTNALLKSRLHTEVDSLDISPNVIFALENSPGGENLVEKAPEEFMVSLGLAYLEAENQSTIPLRLKSSRQQMREVLIGQRLFEYMAIAVAILFLFFSMTITLTVKKHSIRQEQQWLEKLNKRQEQAGKIEQITKESKDLAKKTQILYQAIAANTEFLKRADFISRVTPSQMYLEKMDYENQINTGTIHLSGVVEEDYQGVFDILHKFQKDLKDSGLFTEIREQDPKQDEASGKLFFRLEVLFKF